MPTQSKAAQPRGPHPAREAVLDLSCRGNLATGSLSSCLLSTLEFPLWWNIEPSPGQHAGHSGLAAEAGAAAHGLQVPCYHSDQMVHPHPASSFDRKLLPVRVVCSQDAGSPGKGSGHLGIVQGMASAGGAPLPACLPRPSRGLQRVSGHNHQGPPDKAADHWLLEHSILMIWHVLSQGPHRPHVILVAAVTAQAGGL